jgi:hypothetical protein
MLASGLSRGFRSSHPLSRLRPPCDRGRVLLSVAFPLGDALPHNTSSSEKSMIGFELLGALADLASIVSVFRDRSTANSSIENKNIIDNIKESRDQIVAELSSAAGKKVGSIDPFILQAALQRVNKRRKEIVEDLLDDTLSPRQQRSQIEAAKADIARTIEILGLSDHPDFRDFAMFSG